MLRRRLDVFKRKLRKPRKEWRNGFGKRYILLKKDGGLVLKAVQSVTCCGTRRWLRA